AAGIAMARPPLGLRPAEDPSAGPQDVHLDAPSTAPSRHCERSEAIHLKGSGGGMDCFVASLLAMTTGDGEAGRSPTASSVSALSLAEMRTATRKDFYSFLVRSFAELHGGQKFSPAWHAEVLAAKLQGLREGQVKRLVVNVPPRHLKSLAASVA